MWQVFEPALERRWSELDRGTPIDERVSVALLDMLPSGRASLDGVASRLAMSPRTLQRHLAEESVNFQHVLDATRRDLARHDLLQSPVSTTEISFMLGFRDANSFLPAFKGWTGTTPGAYRRAEGAQGELRGCIGLFQLATWVDVRRRKDWIAAIAATRGRTPTSR
jgi:AraC-like DNA-binding protein